MQRRSRWPRHRVVTRSRELNMSRPMLGKAGVAVVAVLMAGGAALDAGQRGGARGGGGHVSRGTASASVNRSADFDRSASVNRSADFDRSANINRSANVNRDVNV